MANKRNANKKLYILSRERPEDIDHGSIETGHEFVFVSGSEDSVVGEFEAIVNDSSCSHTGMASGDFSDGEDDYVGYVFELTLVGVVRSTKAVSYKKL